MAGSCRLLVCRNAGSSCCTLGSGFDLHQRPEFRIDRFAGTEDARAHRADRAIHALRDLLVAQALRSEEHTSELQSLMRRSYAVFCLKKKTQNTRTHATHTIIQTPL